MSEETRDNTHLSRVTPNEKWPLKVSTSLGCVSGPLFGLAIWFLTWVIKDTFDLRIGKPMYAGYHFIIYFPIFIIVTGIWGAINGRLIFRKKSIKDVKGRQMILAIWSGVLGALIAGIIVGFLSGMLISEVFSF